MFKGMKDLMGMLQNVGKMQAEMQRAQEELRAKRAEGSAGGGMVTVTVNGRQEVVSCKIDPEVAGDTELVEDLFVAAANQAMEKARQVAAEEMGKVAGGLDPELQKKLGDHLQGLM